MMKTALCLVAYVVVAAVIVLVVPGAALAGAAQTAPTAPSPVVEPQATVLPPSAPAAMAQAPQAPAGNSAACASPMAITPEQMQFSGDVTTRANCTDNTVCAWFAGMPAGSIMLGVNPASSLTANWHGGTASVQIPFASIVAPAVATLTISWPDRNGKGIHSPRSGTVAGIDLDGYPLWSKQALARSTFRDYYAVQQPPVTVTFVVTPSVTIHTLAFHVPAQTAWDMGEIKLELCPMPTSLRGLGYGPFRYCQSPDLGIFPTEDEIEADIPFLFHNSNAIRTYSACGVQGKVVDYAERYGLRVALGIAIGRDPAANEKEIQCGIALANAHTNVDSVIVGNEVLLRGDRTESELLAYISRVKAAVHVPVTTAEIWTALKPHTAVIAAVDYLLVHLYAWWDQWWDNINVGDPALYVVNEYKAIRRQYPGKRVVIGETGWPSGGQPRNGAVPNLANQCRFYRDLLRLAGQENVEFYYFDVFDEAWKTESGGVGKYWGLNYGDRSSKYKMQGVLLPDGVLGLDSLCKEPDGLRYLPLLLRDRNSTSPATAASVPAPVAINTPPAMGTPSPRAYDVFSANQAPFDVFSEYQAAFNHFFPTGFMGDQEDIGQYECWPGDPHSGQTAIKVHYSAAQARGMGWAGVYWQEPEKNWCDLLGGYDLSGATEVSFWAKGERGSEKVEFQVGGIACDACKSVRNPDSLQPAATSDLVTLSNDWQHYTIDLRGKDLHNVIGGLAWVANACANPSGATFYLDDIQFIYGTDPGPVPPTPTPAGEYYFNVYTDKDRAGNHYLPTGLMGDTADLKVDECWRTNAHSGSTAIRIQYAATGAGGNNWAAAAWVHPANNWGDRPGGFDLSGADALCLWARGERGDERVEFKVGSVGYQPGTCVPEQLACGQPMPYPDSVCPAVAPGVYLLTTEWKEYCLPLAGQDLSHVVGGFLWAASRSRNPTGATIYLDDIRFVYNQAAPPSPTPFHVYDDQGSALNHFAPSGWMGDMGDISLDDAYTGSTCGGATAIKVGYSAQGNGPYSNCAFGPPCQWAGVYWQDPENNWGTIAGAGFDLGAYSKLVFCAKGQVGGEQIELGMGGLGRDAITCAQAAPYPDSACKIASLITLTNQWQEYTLDLTNRDRSDVVGGYLWVASRARNPGGATFYLDKIRYER